MAERILLVEDDRRVRRATALALTDEGFDVVEALDGDTAMRAFEESRPDLIILDVMLPGTNGFDVCREIRRVSDVPVVFVTAKTDTVDVVVGLESGGDDYITKPFATRELIARIRALLRRVRSEQRPRRVTVGDLEIDPPAGEVRKAGTPVSLTKTEFRLLVHLAEHPNQVLSRESLLEHVWGYDYLGDSRLVDVHVRRLRSKIETDPADPSIVLTIRGLGYKFATDR